MNTEFSDDIRETITESTTAAGQISLIAEDFENGGATPAGWDTSDFDAGGGIAAEAEYHPTVSTEYVISGAGDYAMVSDSDNTGSFDMYAWLKAPTFDSSIYETVTLEFTHNYNWFGEVYPDGITVFVASDGNVDLLDQEIYHSNGPDTTGTLQFDITTECAGSSNVQIGWLYDANYDYWWAIDDVFVNASMDTSGLEHKWTIDVPAGESPYEFNLEARRDAGADGDDFIFAYSEDDSTYIDMVTVNTNSDAPYTYTLPGGISGTIYIRVLDTDRTSTNTAISNVEIDRMYISSVGGPPQLILGMDHYSAPNNILQQTGTGIE